MSEALAGLKATAHVKIEKYDDITGALIGVEEHTVELNEEEAKQLWQSQTQH